MFDRDVLNIDLEQEAERISAGFRQTVAKKLMRRGVVVAISGGIDSSCSAGLAVPISSRKIVPPSAEVNLPARSPTASVNAPRTWPKSSGSSSVSGRAPQETSTNGLSRRLERS